MKGEPMVDARISEELKSLSTKVREGTATADEKQRWKTLVEEYAAQLPAPPDPREIYVTDRNGILVLDGQGRPIKKT
jgi:hypothetical protein